jgi:hypothetical protein
LKYWIDNGLRMLDGIFDEIPFDVFKHWWEILERNGGFSS